MCVGGDKWSCRGFSGVPYGHLRNRNGGQRNVDEGKRVDEGMWMMNICEHVDWE